jgi:hypothetical protein
MTVPCAFLGPVTNIRSNPVGRKGDRYLSMPYRSLPTVHACQGVSRLPARRSPVRSGADRGEGPLRFLLAPTRGQGCLIRMARSPGPGGSARGKRLFRMGNLLRDGASCWIQGLPRRNHSPERRRITREVGSIAEHELAPFPRRLTESSCQLLEAFCVEVFLQRPTLSWHQHREFSSRRADSSQEE